MKKILSLFALLMTIVIGAKAASPVSIDLTSYTVDQDTKEATKTSGVVTVVLSRPGKTMQNPDGNGRGNRWQQNNVINVSVEDGYKINSVTLTTNKNGNSTASIQYTLTGDNADFSGTWDNALNGSKQESYTWTAGENVSTKTWVLTNTNSSGDLYVAGVTVSYEEVSMTAPVITKQPESVTYIIGSEEYPNMTVAAKASKGELKYKWQYMNSSYEFVDIPKTIIPSAIESTIVGAQAIPLLSTLVTGPATFWVKCVVSDDNGSVESEAKTIEIKNPFVATPVVTPASGTKFVESITMTATCETEGATISYLDGNEWKELPADGVTFTETTSTQVKAICEGYDDSEIVYVTYTKAEITPLTPVSEATTWDFSKVTYSGSGDYELKNGDETIQWTYTDLDLTFTEFNSDALAFTGQFPIRSNSKKNAQNGTLKFNTSVPGTIKVHFTDTGTKASATAAKRFLVVNDEQTEYWTSRENNGDKPYPAQLNVETGDIPVEAGDVTIAGSAAICVSYVEFTPASEEVPAALINGDGYATYSYTKAVQLKEEYADDVKIYYGSSLTSDIDEGSYALTLTEIEQQIIPAETGVIIAVDPNAGIDEVQFDLFDSADVPYIEINYLRPTTTANGKADPKKPTDGSPAALTLDGNVFKTFVGDEFNDYKAYISIDDLPSESNSLNIVFQDSETAVDAIAEANEAVEAPVKVVKNGQLYIGNYNVAGQQVK